MNALMRMALAPENSVIRVRPLKCTQQSSTLPARQSWTILRTNVKTCYLLIKSSVGKTEICLRSPPRASYRKFVKFWVCPLFNGTALSVRCLCICVAFDQNQLPAYVSGEQHLIIKNYPEFKCYRDISYYFKYFMNTEVEAFPPVAEWTQKEAQQMWKLGEAGYEVFILFAYVLCLY